MRIGDGDRAFEKTGFFDPGGAGHLAVAVEAEPSCIDWVDVLWATRQDDSDAGTDGTFANLQRPIAANQRRGADLDSGTSVMALNCPAYRRTERQDRGHGRFSACRSGRGKPWLQRRAMLQRREYA